MSFVFVAVDDGTARQLITAKLEELGIPHIDVGLGIEAIQGARRPSGYRQWRSSDPRHRRQLPTHPTAQRPDPHRDPGHRRW